MMFSVTALETHHYNVGEEITMKLMKKPRGSLRVLPVAAAAAYCSDAETFPPSVTGWFIAVLHCC